MSYIKCAKVAGVLSDNINTDIIYPARYLVLFDPDEVRKHLFEDVDPQLGKSISGGSVVGGENFGCGSAREQGLTALKYAGVQLVVCKSFSRAFYRNGINNGVPLFIADCAEPMSEIAAAGDQLEANFDSGLLINHTTGRSFMCSPAQPFIIDVLRAGGIHSYYIKHEKELKQHGTHYS